MADLSPFIPALDDEDYVEKLAAALNLVEDYLTEIEGGREGQASLAANFARYIRAAAGLQAALNANGYKITGAADGTADTDYVTVRQLVAAVFSPALPGQAGNARKFTKTNGVAAGWAWLLEWDVVDADTAATAGQALAVRTAVASREVTLPVAPAANTPVYIKDADFNASANVIRVNPGAEAIEDGAAGEAMTLSRNGAFCGLQFINGKWRVVL